MLFDYIILTSCSRFQKGRSIAAIYHLLKGKRSIQTLQDARLYQLEHFFGVYPTLRKQDFDQRIHKLCTNNYLLLINKTAVSPSKVAYEWMNDQVEKLPIQYFNGSKFHRLAPVFFERLLLLIQTLTNSKMGNLNFIPVVDKPVVTGWVKQQFYQCRNDLDTFLSNLYDELHALLQQFSELEASVFTDSLTGYQQYGLSSFQISEDYGLDKLDVPLLKTAITHRMLTIIGQNQETCPLLAHIMKELPKESELSNSAEKTKNLLDNQYTAEEIATIRKLKLNTIYDHLVEIALYDVHFPLSQYVTPAEQAEIKKAVQSTLTYKLKEIKQEVNESISYFQIRLVLAVERLS
ncbi:hypothetical protein FH966_13320 [Lentibacillus cibarius]|uniref:Helicase Helix-turn-helix domain-containing protein n=1 Tax=Lentibacillus cibarius TaxID=2583219 RepID=A0A549YL45_9BACI|nr:helix-turn-helix domain-containing protein [Lentibacillus cibarius]TRM12599.1 hypothetical protein FH966_13320 [Lentibacillus cibarius]